RPQGARISARGRGAGGVRAERLRRRGRVLGPGRALARDGARARAADSRRRRAPRPEGRGLPRVVRPLDDVPGEAGLMARTPNPEQQVAIDAAGRVFLSAGAGTGKTTVLV